jgi:hypothetical protein
LLGKAISRNLLAAATVETDRRCLRYGEKTTAFGHRDQLIDARSHRFRTADAGKQQIWMLKDLAALIGDHCQDGFTFCHALFL